jgi:phospholipase C
MMPAPPPGAASQALQKIRHVVVLMLENRSFDNLLGWLYDGEPPPRSQPFEGLRDDLWCPLDNIDGDGLPFVEKVYVRKNGTPPPRQRRSTAAAPNFCLPAPDPGEGFASTNHQLFERYQVSNAYPPEPTNQGFVNDYRNAMLYGTYSFGEPPADPREIMICYTPDQVPVLSTLARQFAVCDHWFGSVPSQTLPNRHFVHAATSCGQVNNQPRGSRCGAPTIFNQIQEAIDQDGRSDLSWKIYCGTGQGKLFSLTRTVMTALADPRYDAHFVPIEQFYADAAAGQLPSYAFVEPQFHHPGANDQHPPQDIRPGEKLIADVYTAVLHSPQWTESMLIVTYDEHGGCYDHVPPPNHATPPDDTPGEGGFPFNRFGVRVPTVVVSPWILPGTIARPAGRTPFDHTSIIATVRRCLGLPKPLTARDAAAPDLGCCLTLSEPRTDEPVVTPLPVPPAEPHVNDLHQIVADILAHTTGRERPEDHDIFEFIHEAYDALFGTGARRSPASPTAG